MSDDKKYIEFTAARVAEFRRHVAQMAWCASVNLDDYRRACDEFGLGWNEELLNLFKDLERKRREAQ